MIIISRLFRIYAAENDIDEEDELKPDRPFRREKDIIVSDIDGYYLVKFLEVEFKKKDLGGIFKRPNGKAFTGGYIKSVKDGKKGVTTDFLAAVQYYYPNIYQDLQNFMTDVVNGEGTYTDNELGEQVERSTKKQEREKYEALKADGTQPETNFAKFLVAITGMNVAQINDILNFNVNSSTVNDAGKKIIPKELVGLAKDAFGFSNDDFKNFKADPNSAINIKNNQIDLLKRKYLVASKISRLKKIANKLIRK